MIVPVQDCPLNDRGTEADSSDPLVQDENLVCEVCSRFGAYDFGPRNLCADCYQSTSSCCPEFNGE